MKVKIEYYKGKDSLILKVGPVSERESYPSSPRINGVDLVKSFREGWFIAPGQTAIVEVDRHLGKRRINQRYELINPSVACVPAVIKAEDVSEDDRGNWVGEHAGMNSLYKYACDEEDAGYEPVEFVAVQLGEFDIDSLGDPTKFRYNCGKPPNGYSTDNEQQINYKDLFERYSWSSSTLSVDDVVKAVVPEFAWHLYPCRLSSQMTYRIIRAHVKNNIDPRWAAVTSDYDFCFTVSKRMHKKPVSYTKSVTPHGRRKPQIVTVVDKERLVDIFKMGHAEYPYSGYSPIEGFRGSSLMDMMETIDAYLAYLMEVINEPLSDCVHCGGTGCLPIKGMSTNDRSMLQLSEGQK
jgi:hypothetical protein